MGIVLVPDKDVYDADKRDTKKRFLATDAICISCGAIINSNYEKDCFVCEGDHKICDHKDFITGRQSVDLRILLDFHIEDLKAISELHGCSGGSGRSKAVVGIMKKLHSNLDRRIDDVLIRKIIIRNRKKFWFWRDIEDAIGKVAKPKGMRLIGSEECVDIKEITIKNKEDEIVKIKVVPIGDCKDNKRFSKK